MRRALFALGLLRRLHAHSWVACTDYRVRDPLQAPQGLAETDPARLRYDDSKCFGYPRDWAEWNGWNADCDFACDRGYNYQPGASGPACISTRGSGDYTTRFPMAEYVAGQTVCVAHTVKNHVAAPCTNPYIPDAGQFFYVAGPGLTSDPSLAQFKTKRLEGRDGTHVVPSFDYKGFQNAPGFCQNMPNMDKATGTACFDLPASMAPGQYTFLWSWAFNSPTDEYTTCWEANVRSGAPTPTVSKPTAAPVTTAPVTPKPVAAPAPVLSPVLAPVVPPVLAPTSGTQRVCFDITIV